MSNISSRKLVFAGFAAASVGAAAALALTALRSNNSNPSTDFEVPVSTPENDICNKGVLRHKCGCCNGDVIGDVYFCNLPNCLVYCSSCWSQGYNWAAITAKKLKLESLGEQLDEEQMEKEKQHQMNLMQKQKEKFRTCAKDPALCEHRIYKSSRVITRADIIRTIVERAPRFGTWREDKPEFNDHALALFHLNLPINNETSFEDLQDRFMLYDYISQQLNERMMSNDFSLDVSTWVTYHDRRSGFSFKHPACLKVVYREGVYTRLALGPVARGVDQAKGFKMSPSFELLAISNKLVLGALADILNQVIEGDMGCNMDNLSVISSDVIMAEDGTNVHFKEVVGRQCPFSGAIRHEYFGVFKVNGTVGKFRFPFVCGAQTVMTLEFITTMLKTITVGPFDHSPNELRIWLPNGYTMKLPNHELSYRLVLKKSFSNQYLIQAEAKDIFDMSKDIFFDVWLSPEAVTPDVPAIINENEASHVLKRIKTVVVKTKNMGDAVLSSSITESIISVPIRGGQYLCVSYKHNTLHYVDMHNFALETATSMESFAPTWMNLLQKPKRPSFVYRNHQYGFEWFLSSKLDMASNFAEDDFNIASAVIPVGKKELCAHVLNFNRDQPPTKEELESIAKQRVVEFDYHHVPEKLISNAVTVPISNGTTSITGHAVTATSPEVLIYCLVYPSPKNPTEVIAVSAFLQDPGTLLDTTIATIRNFNFQVLLPSEEVESTRNQLYASQKQSKFNDITIQA